MPSLRRLAPLQHELAHNVHVVEPSQLTWTNWASAWTADVPVLVLVAALTLTYLALVRGRQGWLASRTILFLTAMALAVLATCSFLGVYGHRLFWALAVQDVVLTALVPLPLVLSRPLMLLRPRGPLRARLPNAFLGSALSVGLLITIYSTGLDQARLEHRSLLVLLLLLVVAGSCFVGPLFDERGPTHGVRAMAAFLEGLLDAVPGLVVLASHGGIAATYYARHPRSWGPSLVRDQQIGGSLMVALSELVGLPTILLLLIRWGRSDVAEAAATDHALDKREVSTDGALQRPWWETDPGPLAKRLSRRDSPR